MKSQPMDILEIGYMDTNDEEWIRRIVDRANQLGLDGNKVTSMRISGKFGVGCTIKFKLADYTRLRG